MKQTKLPLPFMWKATKICPRRAALALVASLMAAWPLHAQTNGPLRVHSENPRYFTDNSGKAILLAGAHTWPNFVDMGPSDPPPAFDFDAYLAWLKRYGHNFTRGWTWEPTRWDTTGMKAREWRNGNHHVAPHPWQRTGPGLALDGKPKFDLEKFNPDYLARLKTRLTKAREAGVFMSVMLFEGYGVQFQKDAWPNHPLNPANNINGVDGDKDGDGKGIELHQLAKKRVTKLQETYVRWLVEGLNGFDNVLYEISNETHPSSTEWQYHMIRFVKQCEKDLPSQHPVGMTFQNKNGLNETLFSSPADWVSPNSEGGFRDNPADMKGRKVVLSDTDHLWGIGGDAIWVWKTVTRGLNPIFMDTYDGKVLGKVRPQDDAPRRAMGQALALSRRINLARCLPHGELSSTGYCLAEPGASYVVFAPDGGDIEVDLTAAAGSLRVEHIHPATGEVSIKDAMAGGARRRFSAPADEPFVLVLLSDSDRGATRIPAQDPPGALVPPYPPSDFIESLKIDLRRISIGDGDNWANTWGDDDHLYSFFTDGRGFNANRRRGVSCAPVVIEGHPPHINGRDLDSPTGTIPDPSGKNSRKVCGLLMVDGVLYAWVRNLNLPGAPKGTGAGMMVSTDHGRTWEWVDWNWPELGYPVWMNAGRNYQAAPDHYAYYLSPDGPSAYADYPHLVLARVPVASIRDQAAHEFFSGFASPGVPRWGRFESRQPVFTDPHGCFRPNLVFSPGLKRYFLVMSSPHGKWKWWAADNPNRRAHLGIFDAPTPWGPWSVVDYIADWGAPENRFAPNIPSKWISDDGTSFYLLYSCIPNGPYQFNVQRCTVKLKQP